MKVLNPAGLKRAEFKQLCKYLTLNGVTGLVIERGNDVQILKKHNHSWTVACEVEDAAKNAMIG